MKAVGVLIFGVSRSKTVNFSFFDMCIATGEHCSTGKALFVNQAYCISLRLNNTSINVGEHNSIKSRALKENKSIFIAECNYSSFSRSTGKSICKYSWIWYRRTPGRYLLLLQKKYMNIGNFEKVCIVCWWRVRQYHSVYFNKEAVPGPLLQKRVKKVQKIEVSIHKSVKWQQ